MPGEMMARSNINAYILGGSGGDAASDRPGVLRVTVLDVGQGLAVVIETHRHTLLYDTALVTYIVKNEDKSRHTVGLRVMLDTYIGANDGVPIYVPDHGDPPKPPFLLTTMQEFPQKDIPSKMLGRA